jgi:DNA primase catalytic core
MPRIPDGELERVKSAVSLERLCQGYGIELKPQGKDLIGRCPFHADKTPSFIVTPAKNLWHCLGACGIGGDNIQLVMKQEKISFRHAVEKLQQMAGLAPAPAVLKTRQGTEHPVLAESSMADHALLHHVADFYHTTFLNQPQAMAYLQRRCCFHPEGVKAFRIGFANRTLGYRVPTTTAEGKKLKAQLQRLGILRESGHEHLNGSVVVPIFDENGNVAQMYGRKITPNLRAGTPDHLYLPGEHHAVWNAAALSNQAEWLVCESLLDALTMWGAGLRNVTCAYGVNGWTEAHTRLVETIQPARIILCLDNDDAGSQASMRLAEVLKEKGVTVLRAKLPPGADINDVARSHAKNPSSALAACIEKAEVLARPAGEPRKHVAMVVDEMTGEPLPIVTKESLETGVGWAPEPFVPAPYDEVLAQREEEAAAKKKAPVSEPPPIQVPEPVATNGDEHAFAFGERSWRVRGLAKNLSFESIKVQLRAMRGDRFHLDTLDMCNAKHRHGFVTQAAEETGLAADILKRDIGAILLRLEELQEALIRKTVEPQAKEISLAEGERETALALLRDPQLLDRILADYERCGIVGESTNKLVGYLAAVSRKLDEPLAVIIQSTTAAGKSSLMEAILAFVPEEERLQYSAMTGQSLYYLGDTDLKHKVLAVVEEEGAERASYALKLLQSEGELTIASTGKDPVTGRMVTQEYRVEGPVMIMLTTTAIDIDEELMNRCIIMTVDESREQTRAIHTLQREKRTLEGVRRKLDKAAILAAHRNAQRLLRPLRVVNPFARQLTFLDDRTRTRRDHEKYLTLIEAIAFLHQYQRPTHRDGQGLEYVEVITEDIATANRIAGEVLGRSLDELPPQTRRLLALIEERVAAECKRLKIERGSFRFSRRDVRGWIGWSDTALKIHLHRLEEMEYLLVHRAARGQSYVYEMLYAGEGQGGNRFVMGLLDAGKLTTTDVYDGGRSGQNGHPSAPGQGEVSPESGAGQPYLNGLQACVDAGAETGVSNNGKKPYILHAR